MFFYPLCKSGEAALESKEWPDERELGRAGFGRRPPRPDWGR
jgi:hypothetical protein